LNAFAQHVWLRRSRGVLWAIFQPLDFAVVRFYGKISYSFYLLHPLGMLFANRLLEVAKFSIPELPISVATVIVTVVSILLVTPVAYLSWRFIEIPFVNFGKNYRPRLVEASVPSQ
jgi:peptidoglycan/LPS O-acetylase OafA/YrhL